MNIDKKLIKEIREQHDLYVNDSVLLSVVSQIKQSILKAIMEKAPKKYEWQDLKYEEDTFEWGVNEGIGKFESVIKEILQTKTNEKY